LRRRLAFLILPILLLAVACSDSLDELLEVDSFSWNPKIAVPLIDAEFSFNDLVEEVDSITLVEIEPDGLINLVYSSSLETQTATDFFFVPNQSFTQQVPVPATPLFPMGEEVSLDADFGFDFDGFTIEFDSVLFKEGNLELQLQTNLAADVEVLISLESLRNQGSPFAAQLQTSYDGSKVLRQETSQHDLSGSVLSLITPMGSGRKVQGALQVVLTGRGEPLLTDDILEISLDMNGTEFLRIHGAIPATAILQDPDTLSITFFESINSGTFGVTKPEINFRIQNSFGLPLAVSFDRIKVRKGSQNIPLTGTITEVPTSISAPVGVNDPPASAEIAVNSLNSNLPEMIEILPNEFIYQFSGVLNPENRPQLFVWDTSKIAVDYDIAVPLEGWVDQMSLTREYEFDGSLLEDVDDVAFRVKSQNELPLSLLMQFYFLNASRDVIDSLLVDGRQIIDSADIGQSGESIGTKESEKTITFSPEKTAKLTSARFIRVEAEVSSTDASNSTPIRILAEDQLSVAIGMQTNVSTEL